MLLINLVFNLVLFIFVLRLWLQYFHASYKNPISQFSIVCTDPLVRPLQKILPGWKGFDFAIIISFFIIAFLKAVITIWLQTSFWSISLSIIMSVIDFIEKNLELYFYLLLLRAIISWFTPSAVAPATQVLYLLTEPLVKFARKYIPSIRGLDFSILALILFFFLLDQWLIIYLARLANIIK